MTYAAVLYAPLPVRPLLPPLQQQRLDGWIDMLDVDLELAQQMLRLPPARLPVPPIGLPAYVAPDGRVLAPEVCWPDDEAPVPPVAPPAAAPPKLLGAYARRARAKG